MARGVNKVILIGNLGAKPEVRYTTSGDAVGNISVATSEKWTDKNGEQVERTEWHRVIVYRKLAEVAEKYLHKGSKVYVEGTLRTRKWKDKEGVERYQTEIICQEIQMLDSKSTNGQGTTKAADATASLPPASSSSIVDDDIPF